MEFDVIAKGAVKFEQLSTLRGSMTGEGRGPPKLIHRVIDSPLIKANDAPYKIYDSLM